MKKLIGEFREFIKRGNVIDMAVGVVIGSAFSAIVTSIVANMINPVISLLTEDVNFADLGIVLKEATETTEAVVLGYGIVLQNIINFLIVALCVFFVIKTVNKLSRKKEEEVAPPAPAEPSAEEKLLTEIRDLLAEKK